MALQFDTGESLPIYTRIAAAMRVRLSKLLATAPNNKYATSIQRLTRTYRGEGDTDGLSMLLAAFSTRLPGIAFALGRLPLGPAGMEKTDVAGELEIGVYVATSHNRDLIEGRLEPDHAAETNDARDPGIDAMIEHVLQLLVAPQLGVAGVGPLVPSEIDEDITLADLTIWHVNFTAHVEFSITPWRGVEEVVEEIENRVYPDGLPDDTDGDPPNDPPFVSTLTTLDPPED